MKVKKSDMITLDHKQSLSFSSMGLFHTDAPWSHPVVTVDTFELIYVLENEVRIYEEEKKYALSPGEMLLLSPHREHGGYGGPNNGATSFYWLHFDTPDISAWQIPVNEKLPPESEGELRRLLHFSQTDRRLTELELVRFFLQIGAAREYKNRLAFEVQEYLRLHAAGALTVAQTARHFGYSEDHLSRLYRKEFGCDLKSGIIRARLSYIQGVLLNTDYSLKAISGMCGFEDENAFVKFFKYHEGVTPTKYRNRYFRTHRNNH